MKTVKLKMTSGCTIAPSSSKVGLTPSGAIIFEVTGVPDSVPLHAVTIKYQNCLSPWRGIYSVKWL